MIFVTTHKLVYFLGVEYVHKNPHTLAQTIAEPRPNNNSDFRTFTFSWYRVRWRSCLLFIILGLWSMQKYHLAGAHREVRVAPFHHLAHVQPDYRKQ